MPAFDLIESLDDLLFRSAGIGDEPDLEPCGVRLAPVALVDGKVGVREELLIRIVGLANLFVRIGL